VIKVFPDIREIGQSCWDKCAAPKGSTFDPFTSYSFLRALEESKSACSESGWSPCHLGLESSSGELLGIVPSYLKSHSQGEYVFDYAWADAFERAGGRYYPKLQISIPFTPATGRRLLVSDRVDSKGLETELAQGLLTLADRLKASSVHLTFLEKEQWQGLSKLGFLQRTHSQFHWENRDYRSFSEFLDSLASKKRKNIKRERKGAIDSGVVIERITGKEILESHWDAFYKFYLDTANRKWGSAYLTREFFSMVGETMPEHILLIMCKKGGRYIAGAINFIGSECLYGRNWGCSEDYPYLHFEVCYYQAIDFAIENNLKRVEAGAQGAHKLARGYMPTHTYSSHWIANDSFSEAVSSYLDQERQHVDQEIDFVEKKGPFKDSK
jgi:predicted N-acyltransferase